RQIEGQVVDRPADQGHPTEACAPDAMDAHAVEDFLRRERVRRRIVALPARDHADGVALLGQSKRQVRQHLAGGRMVRVEEPVEEDQSQAALEREGAKREDQGGGVSGAGSSGTTAAHRPVAGSRRQSAAIGRPLIRTEGAPTKASSEILRARAVACWASRGAWSISISCAAPSSATRSSPTCPSATTREPPGCRIGQGVVGKNTLPGGLDDQVGLAAGLRLQHGTVLLEAPGGALLRP